MACETLHAGRKIRPDEEVPFSQGTGQVEPPAGVIERSQSA